MTAVRRPIASSCCAAAACVVLAACTSIPLSTMWKMRGMTAETFLAKDPRALRVAIRTDDATQRGSGQPQIRIDIDAPSTKPICYAFALDPIDDRAAGEPPLDRSEPHRRWSAFGLSARGLRAFEQARREVRAKELDGANLALSVRFDDMLVPRPDATTMALRIDVVLDRADGYVPLVRETSVTMSHDEPADARTTAPAAGRPDAKTRAPCVPPS